jgi:hypothetical protein
MDMDRVVRCDNGEIMQVVDSRSEDWEKERIFARAILCTQYTSPSYVSGIGVSNLLHAAAADNRSDLLQEKSIKDVNTKFSVVSVGYVPRTREAPKNKRLEAHLLSTSRRLGGDLGRGRPFNGQLSDRVTSRDLICLLAYGSEPELA